MLSYLREFERKILEEIKKKEERNKLLVRLPELLDSHRLDWNLQL